MKQSLFKKSLILFVFFLVSCISYGQLKGKLFYTYFSPKDYGASTQNWAIAQDTCGMMYFANNRGVLIYDGKYWSRIQIPNQSTVRSLIRNYHGKIIAGVVKDMGHIEVDDKGNHYFKSIKYLIDSNYLDFSDVWSVQSTSDGDFYLTDKYIFRFKNNEVKTWKKRGKYFFLCFNVDDQVYLHEVGVGLQVVNGDSMNLIPNGDFFAEKRIYNVIRFGDELYIYTRYNGIYCFNEKSGKLTEFGNVSAYAKDLNNSFKENVIYNAIKIDDTTIAVATLKKGAYIFSIKGKLFDVADSESTSLKSQILSMYLCDDGNLWMALDNGILKAEIGTPFRYWDKDLGLYGTVSGVNLFKEKMYIGTSVGLFSLNMDCKKHNLDVNKVNKYNIIHDQIWSINVFNPCIDTSKVSKPVITSNTRIKYLPVIDSALVISSSTKLLAIIDDEPVELFPINTGFVLYQHPSEPNRIYLGLSQGVAIVEYYNGYWYYNDVVKNSVSKITSITKDKASNIWFFVNYKGLYKIQAEDLNKSIVLDSNNKVFQTYDTNQGLPTLHSTIVGDINGRIKAYTTEGIFEYSEQKNRFIPDISIKRNFVDSTWEGEIHVDYYKNQWINTHDKDLIDEYGNHYSDTVTFRRLYDYLIGNVTTSEKLDYWIGSPEGLFFYEHKKNQGSNRNYRTLIRKIHLYDDSLIFGGAVKPSLIEDCSLININTLIPHKKNSISFTFAAPFFIDEVKTLYSCRLEGYDDVWSPWSKETKKRYTNLREGKYIFKVKAKNLYGFESEISAFKFEILPPWYRTVWAFLAYLIIALLLVIVIVRLYTKRLVKEKEKLENTVLERTQEILMQKEEILAQAESLREANESIMAQNKALENQKHELELQKDQLSKRTWQLRKLNHELMKLSKIASETDNAIAVFDSEGNIQWVNDGFTRLYGYTLEQFKTERSMNIIEASDNPNISEAIKRCLREQKSVIYEYNAKTRDDKDIWVQTTLTNVIDKKGKTINLIAIDSDITKIKSAEEEILKQKREIEDQRDQLARSDATKNKFFRIIAHDLRNPISTLAAATNTILQLIDDFDKQKTKEFVLELNKMAQTTYVLLENLLDWSTSQMKEIPYNPKQTDLYALVEENISLISAKIQSKKIKLGINVSEHTYIFADENMVKTVIRNILSNAIKFTPDKGEIKIEATDEGEYVKIEVKDNGLGIHEKDQSKLFRIDIHHSTLGTSNEKGSGLGLILCKEFIEKNGGEIWVKSNLGEGSTFTFTLKKMKAEFNRFNM